MAGKDRFAAALVSDKRTLAAVRELIRYAVMTLSALRDPDAKYLGLAQLPAPVVHDTREAYGYSSAVVRSFQPSARDISQMEFFAPWLAWLRRTEGEQALRRIIGWAMGVAVWKLGQREGCHPDTIDNRIDRSIAAMVRHHIGRSIEVEQVEEPYKGALYSAIIHKSPGPHGVAKLQKVYVADYGFMKGGRKLRSTNAERRAESMANGA